MKSSLTEALGQTVAEHEVRLDSLEKSGDLTTATLLRIDGKIDSLKNWILGLLASTLGGLLLYLLTLLKVR